MSTNYRRGADAERRAKRLLERRGYFVVRSAGSHSPVDLCALDRGGNVLLVQVKRGAARLSRAERTALKLLRAYGAAIECWRFVGRGKPRVEVL